MGYINYRSSMPGGYFFEIFPILVFSVSGYMLGLAIYEYQTKIEENQKNFKSRTYSILEAIEEIYTQKKELNTKFIQEDFEIKEALDKLHKELLERNKKEQKRQQEDEKRNWKAEGLAQFGAILRENSENIQMLAENVTSEIVKYVSAVQAGFFLVHEDHEEQNKEKEIKHIAAFAYNRKKFTDKIINWGEGLIGACLIEKQTIYIPKVTDSYLQITSGLGHSNPRCILIVPFKTQENEVHGALELASFNEFDASTIEFVEEIASSVSTTITTLKNNMRTSLLLEESRRQAKDLAQQDEKMRQTLKEMKELQEEVTLQSEEFVSFTNSVNHTLIRAEYDKTGKLLYANTMFLEILEYESNAEVEKKHILEFINKKDKSTFKEIWKKLISGGKHFEGNMQHVSKSGKEVWIMSTYVSVRDRNGEPDKILFLGTDTTAQKQQSLDYEGQINALNQSSLKVEIDPKGNIISANNRFAEFLKTVPDEIRKQAFQKLLIPEKKQEFNEIWKEIMKGNPTEDTLIFLNDLKEKVWAYGTFSIVYDMYEKISKIIFIGSDISEQARMEMQNAEQNKKLQKQEKELQDAKLELSEKLQATREDMKQQFREIETIKILNEKTLEGMLDAVITINQNNEIEFFNKAAEEIFGIKRDEVLNKNISTIFPKPKEKNRDLEYMRDFFSSKIEKITLHTRKKVYLIDKHGNPVPVLMTLSEAAIGIRYRLTAFIQKIEHI